MSLRRNRYLPWVAAAVGVVIGVIAIVIASQVGDAPSSAKRTPRIAVSYTHLTLPTIYSV